MTTAGPAGPRNPPCGNCGGPQVANLGLTSHYHVGLHPLGRNLWSQPLSRLQAVVCLNCGLTTFFASDLAKLREAAQQHPDWFSW